MNSVQRRALRANIKKTVKAIILMAIAMTILGFAFESGQQRVDNWEEETGRYGEGLR